MTANAAAAGPLEGVWAGEQFRLTIDGQGGRFEASCATGTLVAPFPLAADGRFTATGTFEQQVAGSGPQRVEDGHAAAAPARFVGEVDHEHMKLSVWPAGAREAQVFKLQRGAKIKLIRCL